MDDDEEHEEAVIHDDDDDEALEGAEGTSLETLNHETPLTLNPKP
jgi:hypothetical protein